MCPVIRSIFFLWMSLFPYLIGPLTYPSSRSIFRSMAIKLVHLSVFRYHLSTSMFVWLSLVLVVEDVQWWHHRPNKMVWVYFIYYDSLTNNSHHHLDSQQFRKSHFPTFSTSSYDSLSARLLDFVLSRGPLNQALHHARWLVSRVSKYQKARNQIRPQKLLGIRCHRIRISRSIC